MLILKRFMLLGLVFAIMPFTLMGQTRPGLTAGAPELTVEQSYLQESIELMIIREQSRAESRDMKMVALEFISDAIDRGNTSAEIHSTLEFLSLEGVVNPVRTEGRVVNNFPDVRVRAATQLGRLGTPAAVTTLISMVARDNEPMVLTEAIKALGQIGSDPNGDAVNTIAWTVNRFNNLNPDNLLALSAIEAFERLSDASGGHLSHAAVQTLIRIAEGSYIRPVQERARAALAGLRRVN